MKILQQMAIGVTLTSFCLSSSVKPSQANPAVLAPIALCAGTAGVGCVLIGVAVIGGVSYYIWQTPNGRIHSDTAGRIMSSDYLDDPEIEGEVWEEPIYARNKPLAEKQCAALAKRYKVTLIGVSHNGKSFICTFRA